MRLRFALAAAAFLASAGCVPSAVAEDSPAAAAAHPWEHASAVLAATEADVSANNVLSVQSHLADLEQALAGAKDAVLATHPATGERYVLTDGSADTLMGLLSAADPKSGVTRNTTAVNDPYPLIALYLGSYYNEIGQSQDAARVLDAGLAIYDMDGYIPPLGEHRSWLLLERGAAANAMKRFDDSLAISDKGLALANVPPEIRAHMYRNRGFALTELGRLDESEAAYRESLKLDPTNTTALGELDYLAKLKAGGARTEGALKPLAQPDAPVPAPTTH